MEKSVFTQRVKRLQEVAAVVEKLPSEIRMAAFELLKLYVTESSLSKPKQSESHQDGGDKTSIDPSDIADFFGRFETSKPAENVKLISAYHFALYGPVAFRTDWIEEAARSVGITVPARVDKTLQNAAAEGKKLFTRSVNDGFVPTVHGQIFFKKTYQVGQGKAPKPPAPSP